jgi:Spy/CpxP family protein refolding chaperone
MNRFRFGILGIGLLLVAAVGAGGADDKEKGGKDRPRMPLLQRLGQLLPPDAEEKLKLTDEQKKQLAKIQDEFSEKRSALLGEVPEEVGKAADEIKKARDNKEKGGVGQAIMPLLGKLREMRQLREEYEKKVRDVLTAEQKKTLDDLLKDRPLRRLGERLIAPPEEKKDK